MNKVQVFAPATVANLGPGFDHLGLAVSGLGDTLIAERTDGEGVVLRRITGLTEGIPTDPDENTASLAVRAVFRQLGRGVGLNLYLHKGLPIGSGLGGSAASAVAGAWAACCLMGCPDKELAFRAALEAEALISGMHADNVAPCVFGGMVLVNDDPTQWQRLPVPRQLRLVLAVPSVQVLTRYARQILPERVPLAASSANSARLASMVAAAYRGSVRDFAAAIKDEIVEPVRACLIPGFYHVKEKAMEAGALACSISGAGPTVFAIADDERIAQRVAQAMQESFASCGCVARAFVTTVDRKGVRSLRKPTYRATSTAFRHVAHPVTGGKR
ncbi:MAG: homoserine kinase [candidate division KSB1 bacterium]|nr:homoserine kinase [candidate division KSB1 bacterium]